MWKSISTHTLPKCFLSNRFPTRREGLLYHLPLSNYLICNYHKQRMENALLHVNYTCAMGRSEPLAINLLPQYCTMLEPHRINGSQPEPPFLPVCRQKGWKGVLYKGSVVLCVKFLVQSTSDACYASRPQKKKEERMRWVNHTFSAIYFVYPNQPLQVFLWTASETSMIISAWFCNLFGHYPVNTSMASAICKRVAFTVRCVDTYRRTDTTHILHFYAGLAQDHPNKV